MDTKRLVKSNQNRIICGVCGGIGQYFGLDATLIRLAWVIFAFAGCSGVIFWQRLLFRLNKTNREVKGYDRKRDC